MTQKEKIKEVFNKIFWEKNRDNWYTELVEEVITDIIDDYPDIDFGKVDEELNEILEDYKKKLNK